MNPAAMVQNFQTMGKYGLYFQRGVLYTVLLAVFAVALGFVLALILALMRMSKNRLVKGVAGAYVEFVRCTPMLVQLYFMFYVVFAQWITVPKFTIFGFMESTRFIPGVVTIALNSAAYVAEIIRAGIQNLDYGQTEAARSLGMSQGQNMRYIVLPQAIKNILPAIANELVVVIKESSVCSVLGMQEIMFNAKLVQTATFMPMEPLVIAAALYFLLTFPASKGIAYLERRMSRGDVR